MSIAEIAALPINELANPNGCRLFLWLPMPHLHRMMTLLDAWGFRYCSARPWLKLWPSEGGLFFTPNSFAIGCGYEMRNTSELLITAKRGKPQRLGGEKFAGHIIAARREHSRKPDCARNDEIARLLDGPRCELFARSRHHGFDAWGNQINLFGTGESIPARHLHELFRPGRRRRLRTGEAGAMTAHHHVDLDDLRHRLRRHVQHVALAILGKPNITVGSEWRWGRKGSLALAIAGPKQGLWHDHECGGGGDLFDLIQRVRGGDFASAIDIAVDIVGGVSANTPLGVSTAKPQDDDRSCTLNALRIWNSSARSSARLRRRIKKSRAIDIEQLPGLDETLRFHPNCRFGDGRYPCLIALMRNVATNEPAGIIRTAISTSAEKLGRKMLGRKQGAAMKTLANSAVDLCFGHRRRFGNRCRGGNPHRISRDTIAASLGALRRRQSGHLCAALRT